jgi:pseudouridine kinase
MMRCHSSNYVISFILDGGVGRNIAEVIGRLGSKPVFYTAIGKDDDGGRILSRLEEECGVVTTASSVYIAENMNTAKYLALLDDRSDLVGGVADMAALSKIPIPSVEELVGVELLVLDANATPEALLQAAKNGIEAGCRVCLDPTSVPKARLLSRSEEFLRSLHYIFPNKDELLTMAEESGGGLALVGSDNIHAAASFLLPRMATDSNIIITLGRSGVLLASKMSDEPPEFEHFPAESVPEIMSSNGAGDTLCGAFIHALLQGAKVDEAVRFGMKAAMLSLDCVEHAISPAVSSLKYT